MDILIKNIEMPKSCYSEVYSENGYCFFHFFDYHGNSHCSISSCKCLKTRRPKGCPLVQVPEHGDLIDRDALATALRDYLLNHFGERLDEDLSNAIYALIAEAEVVLERTT